MVDVILHHHNVVLGTEQRKQVARPSHLNSPGALTPPAPLPPQQAAELQQQGDGGLTLYLRSMEE